MTSSEKRDNVRQQQLSGVTLVRLNGRQLEQRMKKIFAAATSMFLFLAAAGGQTAADLGKKYYHYEVYEVEPGVQMIPKFDSSGVVCEMLVEQTHFVKGGADVSHGIDDRRVFSIVDQLVPVPERGTKLNTLYECMGVCWTDYLYSNVTITIESPGNSGLVRINWRNRTCA